MFFGRIRLLRLAGFDVYVDASWLILAILIVWSVGLGVFPLMVRGLALSTYLWMGVGAAVGLFVSIVLHEMSHSLVARRFGMPIRGITLFIFGGVAEMGDEPTSPRGEFLMALAGPVASLILGGLCFVTAGATLAAGAVAPAVTFAYLAWLNGALAVFNLIPAFPLDGGRMLRAALWAWRRDIVWASRMAAIAGEVFAVLLIAFAVYQFLLGAFIGGLWLGLIGLFLHSAASHSYRQVLTRRMLEGLPVSRFMTRDPVSVPPDASVRQLVEDYVYKRHHRFFPVVRDGRLEGCVGTPDLDGLDPGAWDSRRVEEVMHPCGSDSVVDAGSDVIGAMARMQQSGLGRVFVVEDGRLQGVLTLKDLMEFLALKLELERPRADMLRPGPGAHTPA